MSFFVTLTEDGYALTTPGYVVLAVILLAVVIAAAGLAKRQKNGRMSTKELVFCAMVIALGTVASVLKVYEFPFGGAITFFSMLIVCLAGYFYGPATGILTASAYGILQFIIQPYMLFPLQVIVDYLLGFGALGLAGFFYRSKHGLLKGYILGILGRYVFTVISGWIFFGEYAWEGWGALPYSLAYNGAYIFSEGLITVIILAIPAVAGAIGQIKVTAVN